MRLWSLHPKYLDPKGLVALWREGLLAQAVIAGKTRGYRNHPQLERFRESDDPNRQIAAYLRSVHAEASRRNYAFDATKLNSDEGATRLLVASGQLNYEWTHLANKLALRAPAWREALGDVSMVEPHPLFQVVDGGIATWEVISAPRR